MIPGRNQCFDQPSQNVGRVLRCVFPSPLGRSKRRSTNIRGRSCVSLPIGSLPRSLLMSFQHRHRVIFNGRPSSAIERQISKSTVSFTPASTFADLFCSFAGSIFALALNGSQSLGLRCYLESIRYCLWAIMWEMQ